MDILLQFEEKYGNTIWVNPKSISYIIEKIDTGEKEKYVILGINGREISLVESMATVRSVLSGCDDVCYIAIKD